MPISKEEEVEIEKKIHRSAVFQRMLSGSEGELFLSEIDKFTGYKDDMFDTDPSKIAYNAGRRSVSVFIHNILDQDVESAKKILKQEKKNEQTRKV